MFIHVLRVECNKVLKRPMLWIELAILMGIFIVIGALFYPYLHQPISPATCVLLLPGGLVSIVRKAGLSLVFLLVLVGMMTGQEYSWRTMRLWLSHGVSRAHLAAAKFLAFLLPMACILLALLLSGSIMTGIFSYAVSGYLPVDQINWVELLLASLWTLYGWLPYLAMTFMLAVISRSSVWSVLGMILYLFFISSAIDFGLGLLGTGGRIIDAYLPASLAQVLLNSSTQPGPGGSTLPQASPALAMMGIALYTLVFFGVALWRLQRQDFTK